MNNTIDGAPEHELLEYSQTHDKQVLQSTTFKRIATDFSLANKKVLDIGCSVGSHMQRFGAGSVGITTNPKEVSLGKVIHRDIRLGNVERLDEVLQSEEAFDVIWCNNIFEHLLSPHAFLVNLKRFATPDTIIILGTPMVPWPTQLMLFRRFRGALASAHVNFFTKKTYTLTVKFTGWSVENISTYKTPSKLLNLLLTPFWPHLYLIAKNDSAYRYHKKKLNEWEHDPLYQPLIEIMNNGGK